jgi:hypothetical protein
MIELVQDGLREALPAEDIRLEPPRQVLADLVFHVGACRHSEDVVELFERTLLSLGQPQEAKMVRNVSPGELLWTYIMITATMFSPA